MSKASNVMSYYDFLDDTWKKDIFLMKLENILNVVDDDIFDDGFKNVVTEFVGLSIEEARSVVKDLKVQKQLREWADQGIDIGEYIPSE